ncbi:MAG: ClpXP protease specificity-enhancing factor SspB [Alphaproteobacteria bacterium]
MIDTTNTIIDYDAIVAKQLRAVIPAVLKKLLDKNKNATETPSPHYFYITFATKAKGVVMPSYLKHQYPDEMTIVLQYQFWNLTIKEENFSVVLSFGKTPAAITIPYHAVIQFSDPAVNFMLRFDDSDTTNPKTAIKQNHHNPSHNHYTPQANDVVDKNPQHHFTTEQTENNVISLEKFRKQLPNKN